jgi:hypothetical protein
MHKFVEELLRSLEPGDEWDSYAWFVLAIFLMLLLGSGLI